MLAVAVLLLLAACASPTVPRDHFYRLVLEPPPGRAAPLLDGTLEVGRFRADGLTADRPLIYTRDETPHEVQVYHYHQWIEPPATLLQDQLVEYLRAAGVADRVVTPDLRADVDYRVIGRLRRLEMEIGRAPAVHVELELGLRDSDSDRVVLVRTYQEREAARDASIDAAVQALGSAVGRAFARFTGDLERL